MQPPSPTASEAIMASVIKMRMVQPPIFLRANVAFVQSGCCDQRATATEKAPLLQLAGMAVIIIS